MSKIKITLTLLLVFLATISFSQETKTGKVKLNHYTLTIGAGWTHYINNLDNGDQDIKQDFLGLGLKFYWEPEHRLSLGLETGYYKLFQTNITLNSDTSLQVDRVVVPALLLARMRIVDNVYLGAGMGLAFITNKASGTHSTVETKTTSMANFQLSGAYIYPLSKHLLVGGEVKVFHFANLADWMYSLQATFAVKL